jgi:transposase
VDSIGNPLRLELTAGQVHDVTKAEQLLASFEGITVIADKGYDSNEVLDALQRRDCNVVIPPRSNRKVQGEYDREVYKTRYRVECFFQRIKRYRRIAMRFEKLSAHFLSMVILVAVMVWQS